MKSHFFRTALVLGLLSAIGPFAIDMYLPALPSIGQTLGASMATVQLSLMAFFVSMGIGQIIYGPVFRHVWPQSAAVLWLGTVCRR